LSRTIFFRLLAHAPEEFSAFASCFGLQADSFASDTFAGRFRQGSNASG
jgi:hypothetical protein